jgi:hypothetical protein
MILVDVAVAKYYPKRSQIVSVQADFYPAKLL